MVELEKVDLMRVDLMRVVHVCRKPCSEGTVAKNVLKHGCGALNIDGTRIGLHTNTTPSGMDRYNAALADQGYRPGAYQKGPVEPSEATGRWPANLVLQHFPGCRQEGTRKVKATSIHGESVAIRRSGVHADAGGHQTIGRVQPVRGYADADGMEAITSWACQEGCPVAELDQSTGVLTSGVMEGKQQGWGLHGIYGQSGLTQATSYADSGGASRFFKQVGGE